MSHLAQLRWGNGFQCLNCGHDSGYWTQKHHRYECAECHRQASATAGTLFHGTKLPLTKWFWAVYLIGSDKDGISALRLSKFIEVTWRSAYRMLTRLRTAMGHRDSIYRLSEVIELDDALVGGKKAGKRGRGAEGKMSVLIACENIDDRAGFIAMEAVESVSNKAIESFTELRILANQEVHTDDLYASKGVTPHVTHISEVMPPEMVGE